MKFQKLFSGLSIALLVLSLGAPAQAGMVTTSQLQKAAVLVDLESTAEKREWIEDQLLLGGVAPAEATARVAAMTDSEVAQLYQHIDEAAAGGNAVLVVVIVILVLELTGVINLFGD